MNNIENEIYFYNYNNFHTFNSNCYKEACDPFKLCTTSGEQIRVQGLWRMEVLAKYYGVDIHDYDDRTNWDYYDEVMWQIESKEEREEFRQQNHHPDTYDEYFEAVAAVAAEVGDERAEIKCLIKSLMLKYRLNRIDSIDDFPHAAFAKLYHRLARSKDLDQIRVAERLARLHIRELDLYTWQDTQNAKMSLGWVEREDERDFLF